VPAWLSHQGLLHQHAEHEFVQRLAKASPPWSHISYDKHGTGLSGCERSDFSLAGMVAELASLADHLELPRFALLCGSVAGFTGVTYAVQHPERVSHLILVNTSSHGTSFHIPQLVAAVTAIAALADAEWALGAETLAQLLSPAGTTDLLVGLAGAPRNGISIDVALALWSAYRSFDITDLLPRVSVPTLVLHSRGDRLVHYADGVELATAIPDAQLSLIPGCTYPLFHGPEAMVVGQMIVNFLTHNAAGLGQSRVSTSAGVSASLTQQQLRVLRLIAAGNSSQEMAAALVLSERTVQRHISALYAKIGAHNRADATAFALRTLHG
jgi:pimeloyl-ACP methyl ester carboxylesterase/DNA-binding CsgD family transcriptional regulator